MVFRKKKNNDIKDKIEKAVVKPKEINKPDNYKLVSDSLKELESVFDFQKDLESDKNRLKNIKTQLNKSSRQVSNGNKVR